MVISTLLQQTIAGVSTTQGHALSVVEDRKMAAHAEVCRSVGVSFTPLVVESIGGWSAGAVSVCIDLNFFSLHYFILFYYISFLYILLHPILCILITYTL